MGFGQKTRLPKQVLPIVLDDATNLGAGATAYAAVGFTDAHSATELDHVFLAPTAGVLKNLRLRNRGAQVASGAIAVTVRVNGADTTITATWAANDAANTEITDTTHTVTLAAGDRVALKLVNGSATVANNPRMTGGIEFDPS